ncbi:hypothetical protein [Actinoalloteichus hymeniacidonis]|uniref:Uncharacterized protein n=1 Tax=Actinoalloteichus hymeniacidonis TaxID=340345 RepID=A0AAC9HLA0_9PSEU|nr:hypothetical protein [Actinoalloteichus hymeniacidonis]AOS61482.1 hypothetical protein TL08_03245 [Actinoalloteichus hymeniacidonis]MBB5910511.1 hypothetical protein [Actinoalloteichus hymeniacidonis]
MDSGKDERPDGGRPARAAVSASRLQEVFGDVLPATTSDERDENARDDSGRGDDWYRENRPPHHG